MTKCILAIVAILGFLAAGASAADQLIFLKGGRVFHGEVLKSDWKTVTIKRTRDDGGQDTITVPVADCEAYFYYTVRDKAIGDDAKGRIQLAKFCVHNDMFPRAKAQMDRARSIDQSAVDDFMQNEFPKIKEGLAERVLHAGRRALRAGSTKMAKKYASLILTQFEGTTSEPEAEKLLDEVRKKIDAEKARKRAQRRRSQKQAAEIDARQAERERDGLLGPIEKLLDGGATANDLGLRAKNISGARKHFDTAAARYESAVKRADSALKGSHAEDLMQALQEMRADAVRGGVSAYLNAAHSLAARGSFVEATKYTNKALALDPDNAEAKSARAEISTTGGGWGRRRGGRR